MFKQAIIASAVLAATTGLAFANGATYVPAPGCVHTCYVGVAVSRDFFNLSDSDDNDHNNFNTDDFDFGNDGWDGELNAGIGWVFQDHYYLGAEIFGDISNTKINFGEFGDIKNKYIYGIDAVPGVKISDSTMAYGKVGYVRGGFSGDGVFSNDNNDDEDNIDNRNGLQLGLGLATMVTNNVAVNLEYDWNYFSKFSDTDVRPTVDQVKLGVKYMFNS